MIFRTGGAQQIVSKRHTYFVEGQFEARPALATTADHLDTPRLPKAAPPQLGEGDEDQGQDEDRIDRPSAARRGNGITIAVGERGGEGRAEGDRRRRSRCGGPGPRRSHRR